MSLTVEQGAELLGEEKFGRDIEIRRVEVRLDR